MGRFSDCFVTAQFISHNDIPSLRPEKTKADLFPNNKGKWWGCMKLLPYFQWVSARLLGIFEPLLPSIAFPWSKILQTLSICGAHHVLSYTGHPDSVHSLIPAQCIARDLLDIHCQHWLHWAYWNRAECIHLANVYTFIDAALWCKQCPVPSL